MAEAQGMGYPTLTAQVLPPWPPHPGPLTHTNTLGGREGADAQGKATTEGRRRITRPQKPWCTTTSTTRHVGSHYKISK